MAVKSFIIDLDGTVWDCFPSYARLIHNIKVIEVTETLSRLKNGQPIATVLKLHKISPRNFAQLCEEGKPTPRLYPGVHETLDELNSRNVPLGVVTSLPQWVGEPMMKLAKLDRYFREISYYNLSMRKNKAKTIKATVEDMGLTLSPEIWYVGDTTNDFESSIELGISFAWAAYGYGGNIAIEQGRKLANFGDLLSI